jgi:hypothetical protein
LKISRKLRLKLVISFGALYAAGLTYWLSHLFLRIRGEFGEEPHWIERTAGPIHLAAAFGFLFVVGIVWSQHISPAWRTGRHRFTGWLFVALLLGMAASGITIVYGAEAIEKTAEKIHPWVGVSLLPLLAIHWTRGTRGIKANPGSKRNQR